MGNTSVAVIMPCYNAQETLASAIDSVIAQTFADWQIMAVNDGSTDATETILDNYSKQYPEKISFISQQNKGQTIAKELAISNTSSMYIALFDSDDIWTEHKLEKQVAFLDDNPLVGMCYTAAHKIDEHGKPFDTISVDLSHRGYCYEEFIMRNRVVASSVVLRRDAIKRVGSFDNSFSACENWDLWIRIAKHFEIEFIDEPLTLYRVHPYNMSRNFDKIFKSRLQVINKHMPEDADEYPLLVLRKEALYRAYNAFALKYIEVLDLAAARQELLKAIHLKPLVFSSYVLLLKTLLGKQAFGLVRNFKK